MWMDLEDIVLSDISHKEKEKYLWFHLYVDLKKNPNTHTHTHTHTHTTNSQIQRTDWQLPEEWVCGRRNG